jgi:hypothetical protein
MLYVTERLVAELRNRALRLAWCAQYDLVFGTAQRPASSPRAADGHIPDDHWRFEPTSVG